MLLTGGVARGEVLTCGQGPKGELGHGPDTTSLKELKGLESIYDIVNIASSAHSSFAIDVNGKV